MRYLCLFCILVLVIFFGCGEDNKETVEILKESGYTEFECRNIDYEFAKDKEDNSSFIIYETIKRLDESKSFIIARCFNDGHCNYVVKDHSNLTKVICQRFVDYGFTILSPLYPDSKIFVFNIETI